MQLCPIAERISSAVLIFDATAKVVDANAASEKLMAFSRKELIGRSLDELTSRLREREGPRAARSLELATSRALRGQPVRDELRTYGFPGFNESPFIVLVSADPLLAKHGEIRGAMLVLSDFSEAAPMQQHLADTGRQVATDRIAASILHDFGNVLNAILQAVAILEMPAPARENDTIYYFKLIRKSAEHGGEMLHRWREYTRGGAGERASIEVRWLLEEALDLVRCVGQHRKVCIRTDFRPVAPVYGNYLDLKRVFTNLAINAIEAMPHGGELRVSTTQEEGRVRVSISDTGKGISSEESKRLFLPYFTTKAAGTGLGLAAVKEALVAHGGDITFTSEVGRGSCFIVELPELGKEKRV